MNIPHFGSMDYSLMELFNLIIYFPISYKLEVGISTKLGSNLTFGQAYFIAGATFSYCPT